MNTSDRDDMAPVVMVCEEFMASTGIAPERLRELLALGWLESRTGEDARLFFRDADIYRVRKLERICCDFELPVVGGTIIVDLLERIDALERKVRELQDFDD
ncbi:chaperone modulator CbpM [uncultured Desulfovibrio sp.]|uniref:chaperone modulator CbpM n=1 Tax=uncultured Desulfovibrio sp. TaxID=167968 RepID=UPI00262606AD|nr:chaperone modulator CbpM [uncultured Desulfovibrio sp.]